MTASREHQRAVDQALRTGDALEKLFDRMGHVDAPRGRILSSYRVARRALGGRLGNAGAVIETLDELRRSVTHTVDDLLQAAVEQGMAQARSSLALYNVRVVSTKPPVAAAREAWLGALTAQLTAVRGLALIGPSTGSGADESLILGDDERVGLLSPGPVVREGARWLAWLTVMVFEGALEAALARAGRGEEFFKQAIAVLDRRTTDCCLRVHGQTQPINKPFKLTGEPRYADEVDWPPFHWWCRTATALVLASEANDDLTREMREAARRWLTERAKGKRPDQKPANAFGG